MNEAEFIDQNQAEAEPEVAEKVVEEVAAEEEQAPQLSATEQKAFDQGWRPQEEFEGPDENWKTAKEYVKDGEWIGKVNELSRRLDSQKADFDERLENTNKIHEARRKAEIESLRQQQRDAVDSADTATYDKASKQIEDLESQPEDDVPTVTKDPAMVAWEEKNPWINEKDNEKAGVAKGLWNNFIGQNPNGTVSQALAHVDERIGKLYPTAGNPRREQPDTNEPPPRKAKAKGRDLSMSDLTPAEQGEYNQFGKTMFKTEKAFLKAVADSRKKS